MEVEKKLSSVSYKIIDLIGVMKRYNTERELSDVIEPGLSPVNKKALKYIKKTIKSCKYPYVESKEEIISAVETFTELWLKAIHTEGVTPTEFKYLREIFHVYILACTKYFSLIK